MERETSENELQELKYVFDSELAKASLETKDALNELRDEIEKLKAGRFRCPDILRCAKGAVTDVINLNFDRLMGALSLDSRSDVSQANRTDGQFNNTPEAGPGDLSTGTLQQ